MDNKYLQKALDYCQIKYKATGSYPDNATCTVKFTKHGETVGTVTMILLKEFADKLEAEDKAALNAQAKYKANEAKWLEDLQKSYNNVIIGSKPPTAGYASPKVKEYILKNSDGPTIVAPSWTKEQFEAAEFGVEKTSEGYKPIYKVPTGQPKKWQPTSLRELYCEGPPIELRQKEESVPSEQPPFAYWKELYNLSHLSPAKKAIFTHIKAPNDAD